MRSKGLGRLLLGLIVVVLLVAGFATPAVADPAEPTNYRSTVSGVAPATTGVEFAVVGGDAFLEITVAQGHSASINGYSDEPYIRIDTDGMVWVNDSAPAFYFNQDRYGTTGVPDGVEAENPPSWVLMASDGRYAWHDHRVHWMSFDRPATVAGNVEQSVFPWTLRVTVDDVETTISGELIWLPSRSPLPAILAGVLVLIPLAIWGYRSRAARVTISWTTIGVALAATSAQYLATPASGRSVTIQFVLAVAAFAIATAALAVHLSQGRISLWLDFVVGLCLIGWFVASVTTLWMPVLPSTLSPLLERSFVALVGWGALAIAGLGAMAVLAGDMHRTEAAG